MLQQIRGILPLIIAVSCSVLHAMQIETQSLSYPRSLGELSLCHNDVDGFVVVSNREIVPVQRWNMDKELRGISNEKLAKMLAAGAYVQVNKDVTKSEYALRLQGRLNGGGPILANVFYWGVKSLGYGVPATVAVASVAVAAAPLVAAGGAASAVGVTGSIGASTAIGTTAAAGIASGAAATAGASVATGVTSVLVAGGATTAGLVGAAVGEVAIATVGLQTAATGTAAALGGGTVSGGVYVAAVEAVATGAFGAGMAVWWLP